MTGLIYVAIVALWAAVLIPMWLSRHDADEAHRLERHQEAMGILARFRSGDGAVGTPARRAARRRRTILATLAAATVSGAAAWVLQVAGAWAVVLPGLALIAFVVSAAWATRAAAPRAMTADVSADTRRSAADQQLAERDARRAQRRERVAARRADAALDTMRETEIIVTPPARTARDRVALEGTDIDKAPAARRRARPAWDQLFDQTA